MEDRHWKLISKSEMPDGRPFDEVWEHAITGERQIRYPPESPVVPEPLSVESVKRRWQKSAALAGVLGAAFVEVVVHVLHLIL